MNTGEISIVSQIQAVQISLAEISVMFVLERQPRVISCVGSHHPRSLPAPICKHTELQQLLDTVCPLVRAGHVERGPVLQVFLVNVNLVGQKDLHTLSVTCVVKKSHHLISALQSRIQPDTISEEEKMGISQAYLSML